MDEAAVAVLDEEREENVVCQDDGAFGNNQASAESHNKIGNNASLTKHPHRHELDKVEKGNRMQTATEVNQDIRDTGVDTGGDASESDMTASSQMDEAEMENSRKVYACNLCGKMYTYLVSYKKHQEMHEYESKKKGPKNPSISGSKKYECPDCGCAFFRQARLISHLKHHKTRSSNRRCDQCNKTFASASSWIGHLKLHELRPFWCFSCAKGFTDQWIFSKHMHMHKCKQFTCTICHKSFLFLRQLNDHYNLHTGAKPHICAFCGKGFSTSGTLHAHRKKHRKVNFGYSTSKAGLKSVWVKKKLIRCINNQEREQLETNLQRLSGASENKTTPQNICDSVAYQKTDKPKYTHWEWECCECDLGFHEVTQLHRHYIQHATGEIPMGLD